MADTKEIVLFNRSKRECVVYDANGQTHSFMPGMAKKITVAAAEAKRLGERHELGDELQVGAPDGVTVDDKTETAQVVDPEVAYQPRNPAVDVAALEAAELERQTKEADAKKQAAAGGKQMVNAGGAKTEAPDFDKMTVAQLHEYAETSKIDLGDAKLKDDVLAKVKKADKAAKKAE